MQLLLANSRFFTYGTTFGYTTFFLALMYDLLRLSCNYKRLLKSCHSRHGILQDLLFEAKEHNNDREAY